MVRVVKGREQVEAVKHQAEISTMFAEKNCHSVGITLYIKSFACMHDEHLNYSNVSIKSLNYGKHVIKTFC